MVLYNLLFIYGDAQYNLASVPQTIIADTAYSNVISGFNFIIIIVIIVAYYFKYIKTIDHIQGCKKISNTFPFNDRYY